VLVFDGGTGDLEADVSNTGASVGTAAEGPDSYPGLVSTVVAYDREARIGLNAGRAELRSRELARRAAIVADISRSEVWSAIEHLKLRGWWW